MWVVVKIMVPFWVPKRDHNFDNHPCISLDVHLLSVQRVSLEVERVSPHVFQG